MNTALIALARDGKPAQPPLTLAYVATLLEQRRHIVRIYDVALTPGGNLAGALQQLRIFRPQVVIVAGTTVESLAEAVTKLQNSQSCATLSVLTSDDDTDTTRVCAEVMAWFDQRDGQARPGPSLPPRLDDLPFPARHLLSLESYNLRAIGGELQTTLLVGELRDGKTTLRDPAQIVAELRSVSREFGFRHYCFPSVVLTGDGEWLFELLTRLRDADLNVSWEGQVDLERLEEEVVEQMARAGCELMSARIGAAKVFTGTETRNHIKRITTYARQRGIYVRADVQLEPPFEAAPQLVDVAATFGLDDVTFSATTSPRADKSEAPRLEAMARQRYDEGRDRQRYIERFGPTIGGLLWRLRGTRQTTPLPDQPDERERTV